jgi:hypothetical protein
VDSGLSTTGIGCWCEYERDATVDERRGLATPLWKTEKRHGNGNGTDGPTPWGTEPVVAARGMDY